VKFFRVASALTTIALLGPISGFARELNFEERVSAQEAIERVYYSHQIGTTRPFEEVIPREALENKVHAYLRQSAALESFWHTPVTTQMLQHEMERIARDTKYPDRLREIFDALGNDWFLIQECLVRPTLVDHLARNFFASDTRIHGGTRTEAEDLRTRLIQGELSIYSWDSHRSVVPATGSELPDTEEAMPGIFLNGNHSSKLAEAGKLNDESSTHSRNPSPSGGIGSIRERSDAFVFQARLSDEDDARVALYVFPKISWDSWWSSHELDFGESLSFESAIQFGSLPVLTDSSQPDALNCIQGDTWSNGVLDGLQPRGGPTQVWTGSHVLMWGGGINNQVMNTGAKYDPLTDTWTRISSVNAPVGRSSHTAVWSGSEMIIWGGSGGSGIYLNTGGRYNPATDTWTAVGTYGAPSARLGHTAVWTGERMIVWGGLVGSQFINSGGIYDPTSGTWVATSLVGVPSPRAGHAAVWTGHVMIVWGGSDWTGFYPVPPPSLSTGGRLDPITNQWQPTAIDPLAGGRANLAAVWTGTEMLIWGGFSRTALSTGARYDPVQDQWRPMSATNQPSARWMPDTVWTGREMVVWEGYDGNNLRSGGRYDPSTDQWLPMSALNSPNPHPRFNAVWTGSLMIVWGGFQSPYGGRYDPATDAWTSMSEENMKEPLAQPAMVWTGSELVVWGGMSVVSGYESARGARYDPVLDRWSPIATANQPQRTEGAAAHWTGNEMLVWGGYQNQFLSPVNTGGRYNPRTDSWSGIANIGDSFTHEQSTSVWTGSRMILWGGYGSTPGVSYDPVTNTWKRISTMNAPVLRKGHSAVWTGTEMVVWAGTRTDTYPNSDIDDGGRYDPALDRWTPLSRTGAPVGRHAHSAVWTGREMIIWGGITQAGSTSNKTNTGGLYDPATDSWLPISTDGAPRERTDQTAVWTGREMIIWGGRVDNQPSDSGAAYDPSQSKWRTLSLVNAPEARWGHSAVWTGEMMIIWGGPYYRYAATGGRYFPDPVVDRVTADAGEDVAVECAHFIGTPVTLSAHGGTCGDPVGLRYTWTGPFAEGGGSLQGMAPTLTLPFGASTLHLRVDDGRGHSADDEIVVTIRDTTPPDLACPIANAVECASPLSTSVLVPVGIVADTCDSSPTVINSHGQGGADASGDYPLGGSEVTLIATDSSGNQSSCAFTVVVKDTTPPQISLIVSPATLWPPNHRMLDVGAPVIVTDACSTPAVVLDSITSSELDDFPGSSDGNTAGDIQGASPGTPDFAFQLRAERDGAGGGRNYRVTYNAVDTAGNRSTASALVLVPHDQGGITEPVILTAREEAHQTTFSWGSVPDAERYQMIRGVVGGLSEMSNFIDLGSVSCIEPSGNVLMAERTDSQVPPVGSAYFYLVSYNDGLNSGYGTDAASKPRIKTSAACDATGIPVDLNPTTGDSNASSAGDRRKSADSP
jgi:N-acetylneuraminic acid mutarotase